MICSLMDASSNLWAASSALFVRTNEGMVQGGNKPLSGTLTQVRVTRGGSDTFDAGSVNIMYQ